MKDLAVKGMSLLLLLAVLSACATTKEPRHAPNCRGEYEPINTADKYPVDQGRSR